MSTTTTQNETVPILVAEERKMSMRTKLTITHLIVFAIGLVVGLKFVDMLWVYYGILQPPL